MNRITKEQYDALPAFLQARFIADGDGYRETEPDKTRENDLEAERRRLQSELEALSASVSGIDLEKARTDQAKLDATQLEKLAKTEGIEAALAKALSANDAKWEARYREAEEKREALERQNHERDMRGKFNDLLDAAKVPNNKYLRNGLYSEAVMQGLELTGGELAFFRDNRPLMNAGRVVTPESFLQSAVDADPDTFLGVPRGGNPPGSRTKQAAAGVEFDPKNPSMAALNELYKTDPARADKLAAITDWEAVTNA